MRYLSTRGGGAPKRFCDILLEGLAEDGGLYLPERYPQVDAATLAAWRGLSYAELAFEILSLYIDDIPPADLRAQCHKTYTEAVFGTPEIVPLKKRISDEQLLRYNGMLIGVFELLADARSQIGSVNASIEAMRDFWLAKADLDFMRV